MGDKSLLNRKIDKWLLLPVLLVIITFSSSLNYDFVGDDIAFLVNNQTLVSQPFTEYFQLGVWSFSSLGLSEDPLYRPLALLNYRLQSELWGGNPIGFHFVNLLAHAMVTVLVFLLLAFLIPSATSKSIALATSIFAVHPVQVESVCWILGNNDIWAALWSFTAIILLFNMRDKNKLYTIGLAMLAIFAAMLTKEVAYTLPGLLAILFLFREDKFTLKRNVILTVLSAVILVVVLLLRNNAVESPGLFFSIDGIGNAFTYFLGYVKTTIFPLPQRFYLVKPTLGMVAPWEMIIGLLAITGFTVLLWKEKKDRRFLMLSAILYLIILAPALAVSFHAVRPTFASRLLYLAIFPLSMVVLFLLNNHAAEKKKLMERLVMAVILVFTFISIWTGSSWKDQGSFIQLAMASTPNNYALHIDMGDFYIKKGELNEAIKSYNSAKNISSNNRTKIIAHERLGEIYAQQKSFKSARQEFEAVLKIEPESSSARNGMGNIAWLSGDLNAAKKQYEMALLSDPKNHMAERNLAAIKNLLSQKK